MFFNLEFQPKKKLKIFFNIIIIFIVIALPVAYVQSFGYRWHIVIFDEALLVTTISIYTIIYFIIARQFNITRAYLLEKILIIITSIALAIQLLIFCGVYVADQAWGGTFNYELLKTYALNIHAAIEFLPYSEEKKNSIISYLPFFGLAIIIIIILFSYCLSGAVFDAFKKMIKGKRLDEEIFFPTFMRLFVISTLCMGVCYTYIICYPYLIRGEPFVIFFDLIPNSDLMGYDAHKLAVALEDTIQRSNYTKPEKLKQRHIVIIISDALRADHMGVYGYKRETTPFLSDLYNKKQLYRPEIAVSTCSESYCGVTSTLASRPFHEITTQNFKIHELLHDIGYKTNFFLSGDHRSWNHLFNFYGKEIDNIFDFKTANTTDVNNDSFILKLLDNLSEAGQQPNFFYFHLMSSHSAGKKLPEFEMFKPAFSDTMRLFTFWNELAGAQRIDGRIISHRLKDNDVQAVINRYDNGVLQSDYFISEIFKTLDHKGYLQNSTIVILGDHGDALGEHGHFGHTRYLYQEDINIPFLIYDQDISLYKSFDFATQIDVAPTLIDRLGLAVPNGWQGVSLMRPVSGRLTFHQTRRGIPPCIAFIENSIVSLLKYTNCAGADHESEAVFDLKNDRSENVNLLSFLSEAKLSFYRNEFHRRLPNVTNTCRSFECLK